MAPEHTVAQAVPSSGLHPRQMISSVQFEVDPPVRPREVEFDRSLAGQADDVMQYGLWEVGAGEIAQHKPLELRVRHLRTHRSERHPEGRDPRSATTSVGLQGLNQGTERHR